jgi:hypothetical protein
VETMMMKGTISNWTPWYVDELKNKMTCRICGHSFTKKNVEPPWIHL